MQVPSKLLDFLGKREMEYRNAVYVYFVGWCQHHADRNLRAVRSLTANAKVWGWYQREWESQVETVMLEKYGHMMLSMCLAKGMKENAQREFWDLGKGIEKNYPKTLLEAHWGAETIATPPHDETWSQRVEPFETFGKLSDFIFINF